jgi:Ran GTPase-activating protein (RanGAP) involved in mRNA processing and transport
LSEALSLANPGLKVIDLSDNHIGDRGACALKDFIKFCEKLSTVKISKNKINTKGGIALAEAILENKNIKYLSAAFNCFGQARNGKFGAKMGEAANLGFLRHLDLSYNSMDAKEC